MNDVMEQIKTLSATLDEETTRFHPTGRLLLLGSYEKRTEKNDWYGKDMVLDNEQAKQLVDYAVKKEVYNWDGVERVVTEALAHGNKVVINADW